MSQPKPHSPQRRSSLRTLRWLLPLFSRFGPSDRTLVFIWASIAGVLGAFCATFFVHANQFLLWLASGGESGSVIEVFSRLSPLQRFGIPAVGALTAGIVLLFSHRFMGAKTTDYMEAVALGDGNVPMRESLVRTLGALFCYSFGLAVGREGPLVQLSSATASWLARIRRMSPARKRLLVACGAAAGLSAAYHAPLAGAFFVAEVVLGTIAIESLAPLLLASVAASITATALGETHPLYAFSGPVSSAPWHLMMYPLLGLVVGAASVGWLHLLRSSRQLFGSIPLPIWARLGLGGMIVGCLALWNVEALGNGAHMIQGILDDTYGLRLIALLLLLRLLSTASSFGCGALGGVFTPTLLTGATIGCLLSLAANTFLPADHLPAASFALAGMCGFLAASAQAPITAILMVFELTRRYDLIVPLAMTSVVAYTAARAIRTDSLYAESLRFGPSSVFDQPLAKIRVADIMRANPFSVQLDSPFRHIAAAFLTDTTFQLWVVSRDERLLGRILLSEVEPFLRDDALADTVIAGDLMQEEPLCLKQDDDLPEALRVFTASGIARLPVVGDKGKLLGALSRSDLFILLAELSKREQARI